MDEEDNLYEFSGFLQGLLVKPGSIEKTPASFIEYLYKGFYILYRFYRKYQHAFPKYADVFNMTC